MKMNTERRDTRPGWTPMAPTFSLSALITKLTYVFDF